MSGGREDARHRREFVTEAEVILEQAQETLASIEETGEDVHPDVLNSFFRSIHSLKGLAGMVGLPGVTETAHEFEALLDGIRMGRVPLDAQSREAARAALSGLSDLAGRLSAGDQSPAADPELLSRLRAASTPRREEPKQAEVEIHLPPALERVLTDYERHRLDTNGKKGNQVLLMPLELSLEGFDEGLRGAMTEAGKVGELIGTFPGSSESPELMSFLLLVGAPPVIDPAEIARRCGAKSFERLDVPSPAPVPAPPAQPLLTEALLEERRRAAVGTVRVTLDKIGSLLDLTGELSLARNALRRAMDRVLPAIGDRSARHEAQRAYANLDRAVNALGRAALATRLVPVEQLTSRLGRSARAIAAGLGKEATFEVLGGETEIDKILADALADPLVHLLRNALDHGIEPPAERTAAGKPPAGHIVLTAAARGREVVITLEDDGRGIDPQKILAAARERGILPKDAPDPEDPLELVFRPGFSTATAVSELSGRGVGLDVVRSNIGAMKGSVAITSTPGRGTRFDVIVPITLAIVESLLVRAGGRSFAFPTSSIARTLRAEGFRVRTVQGREVVSDEGEAVILVPLARLLGLPERPPAARRTIVVAEEGNRRAGFEVEEIEGLLDLVVKPLSDEVPRAREITGTAELPDGDVALTLDARLLLDRAQAAAA